MSDIDLEALAGMYKNAVARIAELEALKLPTKHDELMLDPEFRALYAAEVAKSDLEAENAALKDEIVRLLHLRDEADAQNVRLNSEIEALKAQAQEIREALAVVLQDYDERRKVYPGTVAVMRQARTALYKVVPR